MNKMRSILINTLVVWLVLATAAVLAGCEAGGQVSAVAKKVDGYFRPRPVKMNKAKRKTIIVFFDVSGSTKPYRGEYIEDFKAVLPLLGFGDRIIVSEITENSVQEAGFILDRRLPVFIPKEQNNPYLEKDNWLVQAALKEKQSKEKAKFKRQNDIEKIRAEIVDRTAAAISAKTSARTNIFSAVKLAERIFNQTQDEKYLVFFSDMIEDGGSLDFERENFASPGRIQEIINMEAAKAGEPPRLSGVKVYVYGARVASGGDAQFYMIKNFWSEYFKSTQAELADYGRRALRRW